MYKNVKRLRIWVTISLFIGLVMASLGTHIQYPCPPLDSAVCVSHEKAIMHFTDLFNNKQGSLTTFVSLLVLASLASFTILSVYIKPRKSGHSN